MALDDTRDKILKVADKLFRRFGFHKTSMDEIAKVSRKAKGSLYYHFSSKEALFTEVVTKEMDKLKSKLEIVTSNNKLTPSEKLKTYMQTRMDELDNALNYHETIQADFFEQFEFIDDLRQETDKWEKQQLKIILSEGIEKKEFSISEDLNIFIDMILMILKGLEIPFYLQGKNQKYLPHFDGLLNVMIKGIS